MNGILSLFTISLVFSVDKMIIGNILTQSCVKFKILNNERRSKAYVVRKISGFDHDIKVLEKCIDQTTHHPCGFCVIQLSELLVLV